MQHRRILVATDLSSDAQAALAEASRVARSTGAALHVLYVASREPVDELLRWMPEAGPTASVHIRAVAERRLQESLASIPAAAGATFEVAFGKPVAEILAAVERTGADLLVLGARGASGRRMGSVAGRCVRKAHVPVLMIPAEHKGGFGRIVACVDFSELSGEVMREAASLAALDKGELTAVYVHDTVWDSAFGGPAPAEILSLEQQFPRVLQARFDAELAPLARGTAPRLELLHHADYGRAIVDYANASSADLVVLGTTGRSGLAYALLGTTAEKVMRDVGTAVLAIKQRA